MTLYLIFNIILPMQLEIDNIIIKPIQFIPQMKVWINSEN